jgi:hypothetical protein
MDSYHVKDDLFESEVISQHDDEVTLNEIEGGAFE